MVGNRSIGIRSQALVSQLAMVTLSFWGWPFIWKPALFEEPGASKQYLLYNEFLLIGMLPGSGRKREASGLHHERVGATRQSFRQTLLGLFCILLRSVVLSTDQPQAPRHCKTATSQPASASVTVS